MNKFTRNLTAAALLVCLAAFGFSACDSSGGNGGGGGGSDATKSGEHTLNAGGMGGEGLLDDGGEIKPTELTRVATGVVTDGEHQIILGETEGSYELFGGNALATWSDSSWSDGSTVNRVRCPSEDKGIIFTLDTESVADVTKLGFMVTLINNRAYTDIRVSTDKENWSENLTKNEEGGIGADYKERISSLRGKATNDANLYQCYFSLAEYAQSGSKVYVRCGMSSESNGLASSTGTDVIDYISWFESLTVNYEYL